MWQIITSDNLSNLTTLYGFVIYNLETQVTFSMVLCSETRGLPIDPSILSYFLPSNI